MDNLHSVAVDITDSMSRPHQEGSESFNHSTMGSPVRDRDAVNIYRQTYSGQLSATGKFSCHLMGRVV
jgi:hypothetical protein